MYDKIVSRLPYAALKGPRIARYGFAVGPERSAEGDADEDGGAATYEEAEAACTAAAWAAAAHSVADEVECAVAEAVPLISAVVAEAWGAVCQGSPGGEAAPAAARRQAEAFFATMPPPAQLCPTL